ncbi:MAG: hypothetical protein HONBIEJF_02204 [Fimbriimonadaceae bacterium]|nr:hypothetical protein [Fimbriimonadaceae bacterium]
MLPTLAQIEDPAQPPPPITFSEPTLRADGDWDVYFPSAVRSPYPENDVVALRVRLPKRREGPVPAVIVLHYLGATDLRLESAIASELVARGLGAVMIALPYHMSRTPAGKTSGEMALRPDVPFLRSSIVQAVSDVRRTIDWVNSRPEFLHDGVGLAGTSLGAVVSSLTLAVDPRVRTATFSLGGVDLAHILWRSSRTVNLRDMLRRQGYNEERLREELAPVEPRSRLDPEDKRPTLAIGARYDTVMPPVATERLIASLGNAKSLWVDTGHYGSALIERRIIRVVSDFLAASMLGRPYDPPKSIGAPTIRLGVQGSDAFGVQVAVGIDLWRSNRQGDAIASALLTPKGPLGFVGYRISSGLFVGATFSARRTTWGVFWNIVL